MSIGVENKEYSLPPQCNGKCRGIIELEIAELNWSASPCSSGRRTKTSINYIGSGGVCIKFIWWGENYQKAAVFNLRKESFKKNSLIRYSIKTNSRLFQNYLSKCEPIELKFSSANTNLQIGTSFAKIPATFIKNCLLDEKLEESAKFKIFSPKNQQLGDITINFKMMFYESQNSARSLDHLGSSDAFNLAPYFPDDLDLKNLVTVPSIPEIDTYRSYTAPLKEFPVRNRYKSDSSTKRSVTSSNIINYLSGVGMTQQEEDLALQEIHSTSPLESVVHELISSSRQKHSARNLLNKIDSLRLTLKSMSLSQAGMRELSVKSLANITFTVECRISPNLLDNVRSKYDYDVMRFYSDTFDDKEKRVDFNRDALRSVKIPGNEFDQNCVEHAHLLFSIWWREFGSKHSRCLGTAKFRFTSLIATEELEQTKQLALKSCLGDITVGYVIAKVTLGSKAVHFGPDLIAILDDDLQNDNLLETEDSSSSIILPPDYLRQYDKRSISTRPKSSNQDNNENDKMNHKNSCRSQERVSSKSCSTSTGTITSASNNSISSSTDKDEQLVESVKTTNEKSYKLLQGLLYVGGLRNVKALEDGGYFLVCHAFWKEDTTSTDFCRDSKFNFLEIFPIINDEKFLERARNNHLTLELWQKTRDSSEQLYGIIKLPLHQFFIAFRDATITNHLSQVKLPVISIDGWVSITSPLAGETCGQLQTLLAIGTEEQLEYLKASRGLTFNSSYENSDNLNDFRIPVPQIPERVNKENLLKTASCDAESQTSFDEVTENNSTGRDRLSDLLGSFIDNLAQRLPPERDPLNSVMNLDSNANTNANLNNVKQIQQRLPQPEAPIRKTSDLLDVLQKALVQPPPITGATAPVTQTTTTTHCQMRNLDVDMPQIQQGREFNQPNRQFFKILLEIENALHLPRNRLKIGNKKSFKRNASTAKCKQSRFPADEEPSAYVSFQAEEGYGQMVKSHEGLVYATNVFEKSCNPIWNKRFEVFVPVDLLTNDEKRFILKIWRKAATDIPQCRLFPNPIEDSVIGFSAIDLNVLSAGMPSISGWFNVVDFNGRVNGQIKVNVRPLEDVIRVQQHINPTPSISSVGGPNNQDNQYGASLSIDITKNDPSSLDLNNTTLSRAIKRKFTELEEITQRLKARLFDVTGEPEENIDASNDDQLDEFERDLNTTCEEDEDEFEQQPNFSWLGATSSGNALNTDEHNLSFCSAETGDSQERIQDISECLQRADLNDDNQQPHHYQCSSLQMIDIERNAPDGGTASSCATVNKNS